MEDEELTPLESSILDDDPARRRSAAANVNFRPVEADDIIEEDDRTPDTPNQEEMRFIQRRGGRGGRGGPRGGRGGGRGTPRPAPGSRPEQCRFFAKGDCPFAERCIFQHQEDRPTGNQTAVTHTPARATTKLKEEEHLQQPRPQQVPLPLPVNQGGGRLKENHRGPTKGDHPLHIAGK